MSDRSGRRPVRHADRHQCEGRSNATAAHAPWERGRLERRHLSPSQPLVSRSGGALQLRGFSAISSSTGAITAFYLIGARLRRKVLPGTAALSLRSVP